MQFDISDVFGRLKAVCVLLRTIMLWPVVMILPCDKKKIVFGAWWGDQFGDNPRYFMDYIIRQDAGYKCYWVGNECIRDLVDRHGDVTFVRKGSLLSVWHCATAGWLCFSISIGYDITTFPTFHRAKLLCFWHGTAFKGVTYRKTDLGVARRTGALGRLRALANSFMKYAYARDAFASFSYPEMITEMPYECPGVFLPSKSMAFGTPRIDYLIRNRCNNLEIQRVREKYSCLLNLPIEKKWFLYLPTWRKGLDVKFSFLSSQLGPEYQRILSMRNAIIIEKQHPQVLEALRHDVKRNDVMVSVSQEMSRKIDMQELLLAADRLITDYSSCFCDFATLDRPVIHYAYDYEWYVNVERGVEYDLQLVAAGPIVKSEDELLCYLEAPDEVLLANRGCLSKKLVESETGMASSRFAEWVGLLK